MKVRRLPYFLIGVSSGVAIHAIFPYVQAYINMKRGTEDNQEHSFQSMMIKKAYTQPLIIDLLHNSPDKHFLHNFLVQNDNAFNTLKIYYHNQVDSNLLGGNLKQKDDHLKLHMVFNASDHVQGHFKIVHGGLLATMVDNAFGQLSTLAAGKPCATANLSVNYRKPVKVNEDYMINCEVEKVEGRKVYLKAQIVDKDHQVCTEATALFISVKWGTTLWLDMLKKHYNL